MNADRLMKEFVRETGRTVEVLTVTSPCSFTSKSEWVAFHTLSTDPTHAELTAVKKRALTDRRYFARCVDCDEIHPAGWMHDATMCHACAAKTLGVFQ